VPSEKSRTQSGHQKAREGMRDERQKGSKNECRVKMPGAESKDLKDLMLRFSSPRHPTLFPSTLAAKLSDAK
jgi:hypothetical protein